MTTPKMFEGMHIIDADTHYTEPHDLWTSRAPNGFKDRLPHIEPIDGTSGWVMGGVTLSPVTALGVVRQDGVKVPGLEFLQWEINDLHAGAYSIPDRLDMMDDQGITAQIIYPNAIGFGGQRFLRVEDEDLRLLTVKVYNDAMAEMQAESNGRLVPMGVVPFWDIDLAVAEIERMHEIGIRGINTSSAPHTHGFPDLGTSYWDPIWEAASDLSLPINFHIGSADSAMAWMGSLPWPSQNVGVKLALGSSLLYINNAEVLGNMIYSGVLERFPSLQIVSVESGVGWLPFILDALDYGVKEMAPDDYAQLSMQPSDYFRRQIHACFWFEHRLGEALDMLGWEHVMFETDYPHPTCLYPDALQRAARAMDGINDPHIRAGLMGENAARLYNIDVTEPRRSNRAHPGVTPTGYSPSVLRDAGAA